MTVPLRRIPAAVAAALSLCISAVSSVAAAPPPGPAAQPGNPAPPPAGGAPAGPPRPPEADPVEGADAAKELLRAGRLDDALAKLEEAVRRNPTLPPAKATLARLLVAPDAGFGPEAVRIGRNLLEQVTADHPDHPEAYLLIAAQALADGRPTECLICCEAALARAERGDRPAENRKRFRREAGIGMAAAHEARGDWAAMQAAARAALEADPASGQARRRLGVALFRLGRPDEAAAELAAAAKADPSLEPAPVAMATLWAAKGEAAKAGEWFAKAVAEHPDVGRIHYMYANWLLERGQAAKAKLHADTASRLAPTVRDADRLRALVARQLRDFETAEIILGRLLVESPGDFSAADQLALVLAESPDARKRERAMSLAEMNARQYPGSPAALSTLGRLQYLAGRIDEAERSLAASVSGGRAGSDTAYYLAVLLRDAGRHEDARKLLDGALRAPGVFIHRDDARKLLDALDADAPNPERPAIPKKPEKGDKPAAPEKK